jgi:hypothetical protein
MVAGYTPGARTSNRGAAVLPSTRAIAWYLGQAAA